MKNLIGKRFGKILVVSRAENKITGGQSKVTWNCICECGNKTKSTTGNLLYRKTNSCGCMRSLPGKDSRNWIGYQGLSGSFYCQIKTNAKIRKLEFSVDIKYLWELYIKQKKECALSGMPIVISENKRINIGKSNTASLDRIDSLVGYIKGNVQWVHKDVNIMKNKYDQQYYINICKMVNNKTWA